MTQVIPLPPEPKDWTRHVDARDRAQRGMREIERQNPALFAGTPPPGHGC
jgi:hypothetical protein